MDWPLIRRLAEQWRQVADCLLGDFYPLTSYQLSEELWLAWQFDLPEQHKGMVQVFRRAGSHYEAARFRLRNLDPTATYVVTDLDQPTARQDLTGHELLEQRPAGQRPRAPFRPPLQLRGVREGKMSQIRCLNLCSALRQCLQHHLDPRGSVTLRGPRWRLGATAGDRRLQRSAHPGHPGLQNHHAHRLGRHECIQCQQRDVARAGRIKALKVNGQDRLSCRV